MEHKPDNRICVNCKKDFIIKTDDFSFYEKIKVPPPTFCPECRQMRRMSFRNERNLFRRKCDKTGENIISIFTPNSPYKVYSRSYWDKDGIDLMMYGREFDFSKTFFEQFNDFMLDVPWPSLRVGSSENCEYNNDMSRSKDCYMCTRTHFSENMTYVYRGNKSRNCLDCMQVVKSSDSLYECVECINCSNSRYLYFCENCSDSNFLSYCKNCLDCFMCSNLKNKQYCFKNKQLSKEEYKNLVSEYNLGSNSIKEKAISDFSEINKKTIRKYLNIVNSPRCSGDNIMNCNNSTSCFGVKNTENVKYLWDVMEYKDSMDAYSGGRNSQLVYECTATAAAYNCSFCVRASDSSDISYSMRVKNSRNLFGCIGLENNEYCILNKQYTKEEYEELVPKIIEHMKRNKEYGEFFPMNLSTYEYNETVAQEYFPLSKDEVLAKGLKWNDPIKKNYDITIESKDLPDNIGEIKDEILDEIIGCGHAGNCNHGCSTAYRIIKQELDYYRRMNLSIPRLCPNCRHYGRLGKLNPLKLWHRSCMCHDQNHSHGDKPCKVEFETSYAPERPEIIYCEKCYQQEVY